MIKKWYRVRRNQIIICLVLVATCVVYNVTLDNLNNTVIERDLDLTRSHASSHLSLTGKTAHISSTAFKTAQNNGAGSKTAQSSNVSFKTGYSSSTASVPATISIDRSNDNSHLSLTGKIAQNSSTASITTQYSSVASKLAHSSGTAASPATFSIDPNDKRSSIIRNIENRLIESLKEDKGTGCVIPRLDPFAKEVTQFDENVSLECHGRDWVKCYLHECKVIEEILNTIENIKCTYWDIIYISDAKYIIGPPKAVSGKESHILEKSDHVKISCRGIQKDDLRGAKWMGFGIGYRSSARQPPPGAGGPIDVLIFGFDSTSKDAVIRKLPKSYKFLTEELGATVLNSYNIVGDGTPAALFPILMGKTELEIPDLRKSVTKDTLDGLPFIFYKLKKLGYHTAYYEDSPGIGTFQYRFNGFTHQPADHYLRAFFLEEGKRRWYTTKPGDYCVGDTPRHALMMNITEQFFKLPGSHFAFTFIADITHDDFNMLATADDATVRFLRAMRDEGYLERTLLFFMGDHGPRFANVRNTLQGKLEERLPMMAIRVPQALTDKRPDILANLVANADVLTTPHDIHATILDALDMREHGNPYKLQGADLNRALSLFQPIPSNRSCSEAGIEPHWCACLSWRPVPAAEPLHGRAAAAFLDFINALTEPVRSKCAPRTLKSISWVMVQQANSRLLSFKRSKDHDGYTGDFNGETTKTKDNYQIKVAVGPGYGVYEASATYFLQEDKFVYDVRDVSRVNAYRDEPSCISDTHPHLNKYCYCKDYRSPT